MDSTKSDITIVESSITEHLHLLTTRAITATDLAISYLNRIAIHDPTLNAFTLINPHVLTEAAASSSRLTLGLPPRSLEGIPYTLKDSYAYAGLTVTNGSPALRGLMSHYDSAIARKLRAAGAILLGKTNMPPMAAGGMQRGLYGRAESPYNPAYLTAAFSSGSSNGAATGIAASLCAFGVGSETVSSGRSPASNNALVCYTPSRGVLGCAGLWPLYVTCDVPVLYTRSVADLVKVLEVVAAGDGTGEDVKGDFWREQRVVEIPWRKGLDLGAMKDGETLRGKRVGVPKMYIGGRDSDPHAKHPYVAPEVIKIWETVEADLRFLGAEVIHTDFPLVTNYENDSQSGEANNVSGAPANWNKIERGELIARAWESFLSHNNDPSIKSLHDIPNPTMLFPKPPNYLPDTFLEVKNWIDYARLPSLIPPNQSLSVHDTPGLAQALLALEAQRKRDLDDWLTAQNIDILAFPAQGDVGLADLESNLDSVKHSLQNGVKYSNGNRAIRHLGVPTVSVPMGVLEGKEMPVNVTFAGRAYEDEVLLGCAWAFEQATGRRVAPVLEKSEADVVQIAGALEGGSNALQGFGLQASIKTVKREGGKVALQLSGTVNTIVSGTWLEIFVDGIQKHYASIVTKNWEVSLEHIPKRPACLGWDLKPNSPKPLVIIVVVRKEGVLPEAKLHLASID